MQEQYYDNTGVVYAADENAVNAYVAKVFGWMFVGLMVTCLSTLGIVLGINVSDAFASFIAGLSQMVFLVFIVEVIIVGAISARVAKMNPATAIMMYLLYAVINGLTVGLFAIQYAVAVGGGIAILGTAMGITAVSFGVMAVYGLVTKADVSKAGNILKMGLIGIIILSVVNIFLGNGMMDFIICVVGLFIFLGLTAYDANKIKNYYAQVALSGDSENQGYLRPGLDQQGLASNLAIVGALMLYLDFINMFLFILRLLGRGRR